MAQSTRGLKPMKRKLKTQRANRFGKRLSRMRSVQRCKGCGRMLPPGSLVVIWQVWCMVEGRNRRMRFRFCPDCQEVVYGCRHRPLDKEHDELLVRDMCECCDGFPNCPKVEYLRKSRPGEWCFDGLDTDSRKVGEIA